MDRHAIQERAYRDIVRLCHAGLDARALRIALLAKLESAVQVDAAFFATTDPATLLFTSVVVSDVLAPEGPRFLHNEFEEPDINKFVELADGRRRVGWLSAATQGDPERSPRYRELLAPLGLGDELRAALVTQAHCWGVLCLHRARSSRSFTVGEAALIEKLGPHLAEGLRRALLIGSSTASEVPAEAGVLILDADLSLMASTPAAQAWLEEIAASDWPGREELPHVVYHVAERLRALSGDEGETLPLPRARLRTRAGRWLVVHGSWLSGTRSAGQMAIVMEEARVPEVEPVLFSAYDLSPREGEVLRLVVQGRPTSEIAERLAISPYTVQDHLKAIFDKVGARSRGELVARIFAQHFQPAVLAGTPPSARGGVGAHQAG